MIRSLKTELGTLLRAGKGMLRNAFTQLPPLPGPLEAIGKTVEGRDVTLLRIGHGPFVIVFCAAIHGNEVGTAKLMRFLASYLSRETAMHSRFSFLCIGVLNVDGYELARKNPDYLHGGRIGRFNANGVDLNRNFPTTSFTEKSVWSHGKDYAETTEVFCGSSPGSEPENAVLRDLVTKEKASLLWMFHSVASEIMASHDDEAEHLAALFSARTGFRQGTHEEWLQLHQTGTAKEWCEEQGIMYLESEASERWGSDWKRQRKGIEAVLQEVSTK